MSRLLDDMLALTVLKIALATILVALALYQVAMMAVAYRKVRPPHLSASAASSAHRAVGDVMVIVAFVVGALCVVKFDVGEAVSEGGRELGHVLAGSALLLLLVVKVTVVRVGGRASAALPALGLTALTLFVLTWATSAMVYL